MRDLLASLLLVMAILSAPALAADGNSVLDIRVLGTLHIALCLLALSLLLSGSRGWKDPTRMVLGGMMILFFTEVGYAAYLNSL